MLKDNSGFGGLSDANSNILVKIQGTLLKAGVTGIYEKRADGGYTIALLPEPGSKAEQMTLDEIIDQINSIPGVTVNTDSIKDAIHSVAGELDVALKLNEIYYYHKEKEDKTSVSEYAFEIELIAKGLTIPGIALESAAVAVWNTDKGLERMGIKDILEMIDEK